VKLSPLQFVAGRIGLGENPPPQLGQTFSSTSSTQVRQKVHSKLQIIASLVSGGSGLLQCSQVGLSSRAIAVSAQTCTKNSQNWAWHKPNSGLEFYQPPWGNPAAHD
jgi:hypothetical protein